MKTSLSRRLVAEGISTALLLAAVVGSGIMGERLAAGNVAIALLANTLATGATLVALILTFGPISGAHMNPVVTLSDALQGEFLWGEATTYIAAQALGAFVGVALADMMFAEPVFACSQHVRAGFQQLLSEFVATFGLVCVIWGCTRHRAEMVSFAVGAYIMAAYWFTASTSFANPAVTLARSFTNTFAGIRPVDAPGFVIAQLIGGAVATALFRWLNARLPAGAPEETASRPDLVGQRVRHQTATREGSAMKNILFACIHNAGRSQMAAAFFNALADPAKAHATSAGTQPTDHIHPEVAQAMREVGIELASARPQLLTDKMANEADVLVTMGCGGQCPNVPGIRREDWELRDPKGLPLDHVRKIRDEIRKCVERLALDLGVGRAAAEWN